MLEKQVLYTKTDEKVIERLIDEAAVAVNHMVLPKGTGLPDHVANAPVYMIIARGQITLQLDEQEAHTYEAGHVILIPYKTQMRVNNTGDAVTELFVVKAPGPRSLA